MLPCHQVSTGLPARLWTRKSVVRSRCEIGVGSNHTRFPHGSRIIGPSWEGPNWGATKMSPLEVAPLWATVIDGGTRPGAEWKCWRPWAPAGTWGSGAEAIGAAGCAIVNLKVPPLAPTRSSEVLTVTVSPAVNGFAGRKLAPCPSESASMRPVWVPDFEPVTVTVPSWPGDTPRKAIWLAGMLYFEPGSGNTLTAADAKAGIASISAHTQTAARRSRGSIDSTTM